MLDCKYIPEKDRYKYHEEDIKAIKDESENHYIGNYDNEYEKRYALYWSKGVKISQLNSKILIGMVVDISKQKELEKILESKILELENVNKKLKMVANIDPLTKVFNRRYFYEKLEQSISAANNSGSFFSLLMADLDFFKSINDSYGHEMGDHILKNFAKILQKYCRSEDIIARIGGEEFLILLSHTNIEQAKKIADRICKVTFELGKLPDNKAVTVSIGVVQYIKGDSADEIVNKVDMALYKAKREGRNRSCLLV